MPQDDVSLTFKVHLNEYFTKEFYFYKRTQKENESGNIKYVRP